MAQLLEHIANLRGISRPLNDALDRVDSAIRAADHLSNIGHITPSQAERAREGALRALTTIVANEPRAYVQLRDAKVPSGEDAFTALQVSSTMMAPSQPMP